MKRIIELVLSLQPLAVIIGVVDIYASELG